MSKFKVGDYVVFHPERVTKISPETVWQFCVPTKPMRIVSADDPYEVEECNFRFCEEWLEPAKCEFREKGIALACARKLMGEEFYATIREMANAKGKDNFDDMSTDEIRKAVWDGCRKYPTKDRLCFDKCPCSRSKTKTCVSISTATRGELIAMLKAFRDNGDWRRC